MLTRFFVPGLMVSLVLAEACSGSANKPSERADQAADAGAGTIDGSTTAVIPPIQKTPLGMACNANTDCASGFCTDGVCCDSACGQTCYTCNLPAAPGHCAALTSGADPSASPACVAPSACVLPATAIVPSCRLVNGAACQADGDCVSGHCLTYYVDADGDGYGSSEQAHFCQELGTPPPNGYAAYAGDCCDLDTGANPAFNSALFLEMADACGSFDWNCDGQLEQEKSCPSAVACGAACVANFGFASVTLFTAACH